MKRCLWLLLFAKVAFGDSATIGPGGIDSKITGLDGSRPFSSAVNIGQLEPFRSGKWGYDANFAAIPNTFPHQVYLNSTGTIDGMNNHIDAHATQVAGVLIGKAMPNADYEGVAPEARLHSMGFSVPADDSSIAVSGQSLARLNSTPDIVAINFSAGREAQLFELNGKSTLAQFMDWSAHEHEVLYVVAWPNNSDPFPSTPADNFNGITVGASALGDDADTYDRFSGFNNFPNFLPGTERSYIHILAPGEHVDGYSIDGPDEGNEPDEETFFGTSYATPHVTGAVALIHQFIEEQATAGDIRFFGSFDHKIAKAVLMNSADKLAGVQGSQRDILNHIGQTWDQTSASMDSDTPLDPGMGTGHLNVSRAVEQLRPGRYHYAEEVPRIGWADQSVNPNDSREYVIDMPIAANSYASITLTWDRMVDHTGGGTYHYGDTFFPYGDPYDVMADLNLKLVSMTDGEVVAESDSTLFNVEHIFFEITQTDAYKIVVEHAGGLEDSPGFGLAWWIGEAPLVLSGDYDGNGSVGPEDYTAWRSSFGSTTDLDADGNGDNIINAADYVIWRDRLGAGAGSGAGSTAVPEPGLLVILPVICLLCPAFLKSRSRSKKNSIGWSAICREPITKRRSAI